ncbi:hypothetical protein MKW92_007156, partial [Papaver armeniacum]
MSIELGEGGVPAEIESLESGFYRLIECQTQTQHSYLVQYQTQTQRQLEMYQAQNQRQLRELTFSITKVIQTLDKNAKFGEKNVDIIDPNHQGSLEVIREQNSALVPVMPQSDCEQ